MKEFKFGKRYGLVPYEQTHYRYITKEEWEELRSVGIRVIGVDPIGIRIEPWYHIKRDRFWRVDSDYICEWEEPTLDEWGARAVSKIYPSLYISIPRGTGKNELAKSLLNYQYGLTISSYFADDWANYCKEDVKMTYDYYKRHIIPQEIKDVKFNGPATIVFWGDGTKTIVKTQNGEPNDPEKAIAMCIAKRFLGTNKSGSNYYDQIKKWLPKEEKK